MATIIPALNRSTLRHMTAGEKRFARRLETFLEDDYLCWYDIPVGRQRRYPDFIILHPSRGLLFLEVKDWKPETIKQINKTEIILQTDTGRKTVPHPLEQARQYTYPVINLLEQDQRLCQTTNKFNGKLAIPYGWGVVFTNISRKQITNALPEEQREILLPDHLIIYKDEMLESCDPESFQERLWGMFHYNFGTQLTLPQIDRVRWHLFPEIRIDDRQTDFFSEAENSPTENLPDIVKIMDVQQEQLARSLGSGHRVIHGVAGSGKTLILGYRCLYLSKTINKPILVLCFNITLAAKLRSFISTKGIQGQVQVYHFHDWCSEQLKTYHVSLIQSNKKYWEKQVESVIQAIDNGQIPRAQYGALLIDEGHDFEAEWLKLIVQMIDPTSDSMLLLYDDAQSIYTKRSGLGFSLSSVGIQATGRTTILKLNYRNTREILDFSYRFAKDYISPEVADDDHIPLIKPEAAGNNGPVPEIRRFSDFNKELDFSIACLKKWHQQGADWKSIAILCHAKYRGETVSKKLTSLNIPHLWMAGKKYKNDYDPEVDKVSILTVHSSKGLEFPYVIIMGVGDLDDNKRKHVNARLLYVGMTRAQNYLLLTTSSDNEFSRRIIEINGRK